jgi:hypothetical protein
MVGGNIGQRATQVALKEAQKGGIEVPGIFGRLTQSLDKQKADLQASANTYLNNQREAARKASEITDEQIGAAAEGNTEAYNRVATGATNPTPRTPDALTLPTESDLAKSTQEAREIIGSDATMGKALARGKGPEYSPQMAAFDVAAIKGAPGFSRTLSTLGESYNQLKDLTDKLRLEYPAKAREAALKEAGGQKVSARNRLGLYLNELDRRNQLEADARNAEERRAFEDYKRSLSERRDPALRGDIEELKRKALEDLRGTYAGSEEELADLSNADLFNYLSHGDLELTPRLLHEYTRGQMYDPTESRKFENLSKILGGGEVRTPGDYQRPISTYSGSSNQYKLNRDRLKNNALYTIKARNALREPRRLGEVIHSGNANNQEKDRIRSTVTDGIRAFGGGIGSNYDAMRSAPRVMAAMNKIGLGSVAGKPMGELIPELIKHFDPSLGRLKEFVPPNNRWSEGYVANSDANADALRRLSEATGNVSDYGTMTSENLFRSQGESDDVSKERVRRYFQSLVDTFMSEMRNRGGL